MQLSIVGIGPGAEQDLTGRAYEAIQNADLIVGYTTYINLIKEVFPDKPMASTGMRKEVDRCREALQQAADGKRVALICSGDAGIYGMSGLVYELAPEYPPMDIEVVPGITAACGGGAVLGAPLTHDFSVISLSDLMTPWEKIALRLECAAKADFVTVLYNPRSHHRPDYLRRACKIMLSVKDENTVCGYVRNIGRPGEQAVTMTLKELKDCEDVDMFTTVFIGNSQTKIINGKMVTPRGYMQRERE